MKKIFWFVWLGLLAVFICLTATYIKNEKMISASYLGNAKEEMVPGFSLTQPYISPYNKGNIAYERGEYDKAIEYYKKALKKVSLDNYHEAYIRVNLALSLVAPYQGVKIPEARKDEVIDKINEACVYLLMDGCATEDGMGHDFHAQDLYDELMANKEMLENGEDPLEQKKDEDSQDSGDDNQKGQNLDEKNQDSQDQDKKNQDSQDEKNPDDQNEKNQDKQDQTPDNQEGKDENQTGDNPDQKQNQDPQEIDSDKKNQDNTDQNDSAKDDQQLSTEDGNGEQQLPLPEQDLESYLQMQFQEIEKEGQGERGQRLDTYQSYGDFSYGSGKTW